MKLMVNGQAVTGTEITAGEIEYNNSYSGLEAVDVNSAIDEINVKTDEVVSKLEIDIANLSTKVDEVSEKIDVIPDDLKMSEWSYIFTKSTSTTLPREVLCYRYNNHVVEMVVNFLKKNTDSYNIDNLDIPFSFKKMLPRESLYIPLISAMDGTCCGYLKIEYGSIIIGFDRRATELLHAHVLYEYN